MKDNVITCKREPYLRGHSRSSRDSRRRVACRRAEDRQGCGSGMFHFWLEEGEKDGGVMQNFIAKTSSFTDSRTDGRNDGNTGGQTNQRNGGQTLIRD